MRHKTTLTLARRATTLAGAMTRRTAAVLALMMLTATAAWAMTKTVTYTISYKDDDTKFWLDGSDNTHYNIGSSINMAKTNVMPMDDVTITITSAGNRCFISYHYGNKSIFGFSTFDYTFTFASSTYYITNVKIKDLVKRTELSVDNETKECTVNWNHDQSDDAQQIEVTLSDTKPLFYYGITYEPNGGTNAADNPLSYEKSAGVASFAAPTRAGYTFGGWYDNSEFNGTAVTSIAAGSTGDKTLYAKWTPNTYSVCFYANGGTGSMSNQSFTYDDEPQALTTNAFTREGHNFSGWYTAANGSGTGYANGASVSNLTSEQGAIVNLYARWTPIDYQVTFNANDHGTAPADQTVAYGTKATEPAAPTESGWTFGGWYKESSCVNRWEFGADNVTGNTTLYAKWAQNVYTITYELDGGVNSASNPLVYTNTDNITLAEPTRTGYTFTGWTPDNGVISSGSTGPKTFTATWKINQYTITFDTDGGTVISGSADPITQNYGTTVTAPATLAKQGYLFNGWADLPATMPADNITVRPDWSKLLHLNEVPATCTENGTSEHYYGNNKDWTENSDHLTYTEINTESLVIPTTGHTWSNTPQWTWGINYLGELAAQLKVVCTQCGYVMTTSTYASDTSEENSFAAVVTTAPTETTDGVKTYTATIGTFYDYTGLNYSDTHLEAIPRTFKVAKIGETEYSYLKDAMNAATSGDVITLYGDVIEPNTFCSVPHDYSITLNLNGHSVLIDKISTMNSLTVKNGSLVCNIDNANVGDNNTLTLDNAKLTCVGVYDNEGNLWSSGIQWMAKNIAVTNGSMLYITGGTYLGGGADDGFNLTIDGTSGVVLENATLSGYNDTRVRSQFTQYLPEGYSINNDYEDNIPDGRVMYGSNECTDPVTLGPSTITLASNADNSDIIAAYDGYEKNVTLEGRTLWKDGDWNTLCLPFKLTSLTGTPLADATIKTLVGAEMSDNNLSLTFSEAVTTLEAGVPYIIMWNKAEGYDTADPATRDIKNPVFTDVTVVSSPDADRTISLLDGAVKFVGYYDPFGITADDTDIYYMTANNTLKHTGVARTLLACRAYFQFSDESAAARQITLNFGDDETTRIIELKNSRIEELKSEDGWYTVDGVKLDKQPTRKGLYIHHGRKVVIK